MARRNQRGARNNTQHRDKPINNQIVGLVSGQGPNIGLVSRQGQEQQTHATPWKQPSGEFLLPVEQADSFFGPQQPIYPIAPPSTAGRRFDYPAGVNVKIEPRADEIVTFEQLQALSENCELVRLAIETRKDQMGRLDWHIVPRDPEAEPEDFATRIKKIEDFFRYPDGHHDWGTWLRQLIDQLLVHDAPCVYPRISRGGEIMALDVMDGTLIKLVIDEWGRTPEPPFPAYVQNIHGVPAIDYTKDELIYRPRNPRAHKLYGYSPVEQIIRTCNIAIRRQLFQLDYFTEGNDPQSLVTMPESWTTAQIEEFQEYWDSLMTGNLAERRKMRFITHDAKYYPMKEAALTDLFDEWLARVICFAFSLPPTAFTKQTNRATAETQSEQAEEEGLAPLMLWVKQTMDFIIFKYFGDTELTFQWQEEVSESPLEQAQINDIYLRNGTKSLDEVRIDLGLEPIGFANAVYLTGGVELIEDILNPPEPPPMLPPGSDPNNPNPPTQPRGNPPKGNKPKDEQTQPKEKPTAKSSTPVLDLQKMAPMIDRDRHEVAKERARLETLAKSVLAKAASDVTKQLPELLKKHTKKVAKNETVVVFAKSDKQKDDPDKVVEKLDLDALDVLRNSAAEVLSGVYLLGSSAAAQQVGIDGLAMTGEAAIVQQHAAVAFAKQAAAEMVTSVTETTRGLLKTIVVQAVEEGWSVEKLAEQIKEAAAFGDYRATMIARTEIAKADMAGNLAAYAASGVVFKKQWFKTMDSESDVCDGNAAVGAIPLDQNFPSGDPTPPSHPNCACVIVPVTEPTP